MLNEHALPTIVISDSDRLQLIKLAQSASHRMPEVAEELLHEVQRAEICDARAIPHNTVRMHSFVRFRTDKGAEHAVKLVYPEDANIIQDRLSVLSPIGAALIGLSEGQTMSWTDREGQNRTLTVLAVWDDEQATRP
jgi:regulator of nucleoside diphosphate kinase